MLAALLIVAPLVAVGEAPRTVYTVGARAETRARASVGESPTGDLEVRGVGALQLRSPVLELGVSYLPTVLLSPAMPSGPSLLHQANVEANFRAGPRLRVYAGQSFTHGRTELTRLGSGTPSVGTEEPGVEPADPEAEPVTPPPPAENPDPGADPTLIIPERRSFAYYLSETVAGFSAGLSRGAQLSGRASVLVTGGLDASRELLSAQYGPALDLRLDLQTGPRDALAWAATGSATWFATGERVAFGTLTQEWGHRWGPDTQTWTALGVNVLRDSTANAYVLRPAATLSLTQQMPVRGHRVIASVVGRVGSTLNRFTSEAPLRADAALDLTWLVSRSWRFGGRTQAGLVLNPDPLRRDATVSAEAGVHHTLSRELELNLGLRALWDRVPRTGPGVRGQWLAGLGLTYRYQQR